MSYDERLGTGRNYLFSSNRNRRYRVDDGRWSSCPEEPPIPLSELPLTGKVVLGLIATQAAASVTLAGCAIYEMSKPYIETVFG